MNILAFHMGHDGSVTILEGNEVVAHHQLDRFNKLKHQYVPTLELLDKIKDLKIKFDKVIISSMGLAETFPIKFYIKKFFNVEESQIEEPLQYEHHIFHAKCARHFFNYPKNCVYFIADGDGGLITIKDEKNKFINNTEAVENESVYDEALNILQKYYGTNEQLNYQSEKYFVSRDVSLGKAYQKLTYELGLDPLEEGKTMALSSYGVFNKKIADRLVFNNRWNLNIFTRLNESYHQANKGNRYLLNPDVNHTSKDSKSLDFVKTFQIVFQHLYLQQIKRINWNYNNLILSGGCAQNVLNNSFLKKELNKNILADPFNGDFGISLGAALHYSKEKVKPLKNICTGFEMPFSLERFQSKKVNSKEVAEILKSEPIAIFSGKSEQGQRGLGFRSLLANPVQENILKKINRIKKREWYRPFACTILKEKASKYFEINEEESSPYMMFVYKCKNPQLKNVCSIDGYSRIQTLEKSFHPKYYDLINEFYKITGLPLVLNTSLNLPGRVLCEDSNDLFDMMKKSSLKYCYLSDENKILWIK